MKNKKYRGTQNSTSIQNFIYKPKHFKNFMREWVSGPPRVLPLPKVGWRRCPP